MNNSNCLSLSTSFQRQSNVYLSFLENEAVILHLTSGTYFGLDEIGTTIFKMLDKGYSIKKASDQLMLEYEATEVDCNLAIQSLAQELLEAHLIEISNAEIA